MPIRPQVDTSRTPTDQLWRLLLSSIARARMLNEQGDPRDRVEAQLLMAADCAYALRTRRESQERLFEMARATLPE
jgi:hypothetical protein